VVRVQLPAALPHHPERTRMVVTPSDPRKGQQGGQQRFGRCPGRRHRIDIDEVVAGLLRRPDARCRGVAETTR